MGSTSSPSVGSLGHRRMRLDGRGVALISMQTSNGSLRELVRRATGEWEDPSSPRLMKRSRIAQLREVVMATMDTSDGRGLTERAWRFFSINQLGLHRCRDDGGDKRTGR
jgi:hypothetical protein